MSDSNTLSLTKALKTNRLPEFIAQEEARGIGPAERKRLDALIREAATKPPRSKDRTSRSASRDGSSGK